MAKKKTAVKGKKTAKSKPVASKTKAKTGAKKSAAKSKSSSKKAPAVNVRAKAKPAKPRASAPVVKDEGRKLAESVVNGILEKKGQNLRWLDLRNIENAVCDYFIICEGTSRTQVEAIADSVETTVKKETGQRPYRSEGWENALWILIDYVNVVVHVFEPETRHFYNLESLWADAEEIPVEQ